jgi:hypothetical protein
VIRNPMRGASAAMSHPRFSLRGRCRCCEQDGQGHFHFASPAPPGARDEAALRCARSSFGKSVSESCDG